MKISVFVLLCSAMAANAQPHPLLAAAPVAGVPSRTCPPVVATSPASLLLANAIERMGGGDAICATGAITYKAIGHRFALEQSPRPEGPYFTTYDQLQVTLDFEHQRYRQEITTRGFYG